MNDLSSQIVFGRIDTCKTCGFECQGEFCSDGCRELFHSQTSMIVRDGGRTPEFWNVYKRLSCNWYDNLDGASEWYANGLRLLETIIHEQMVASYGGRR